MTKNAVALRAFTHAGDSFAKDQVIPGIDPGHLADWSAEGVDLVREATALNDQGVKVARRKTARKAAPIIPADFMKLLRGNRKALAAFTASSPSHQREYLDWFSEARTVETRERRMALALEWIAEGKGRNWKYEKRA